MNDLTLYRSFIHGLTVHGIRFIPNNMQIVSLVNIYIMALGLAASLTFWSQKRKFGDKLKTYERKYVHILKHTLTIT